MKKTFVALPLIAALMLGALTACAPDPTVGYGIPSQIQQVDSVVSVNVIQPDAISGIDGVQYTIVLEPKLNAVKLAEKANDITEKIMQATEVSENWGVRFRSGQREIGMSQAAYILDHPEYAPAPTPTPGVTETPEAEPTAEATEQPEAVDSYAVQLQVINEVFKTDGALLVKTYDALAGYVEVSFSDQTRLEEFFTNTAAAIDLSGWKHRGDFELNLIIANQAKNGIITPTGVSVSNEINVNEPQKEGISKLLFFPESAVAMYRAIPAEEIVPLSTAIRSRGLYEEILVTYEGNRNSTSTGLISTALRSVKTPDAQYVITDISPEY